MSDIKKISILKKMIGDIVNESFEMKDPYVELFYKPTPTGNKFKITITAIHEDFFIDEFGVKWVRSNE